MPTCSSSVNKESTFISAVAYIDRIPSSALEALRSLSEVMDAHFLNYEIVCVIDEGDGGCAHRALCDAASRFGGPTTIVDMGKRQGLEAAMNAGIDMAVGDYVLEIDDLESFDPSFLLEAFSMLQESGYDIVSGVAARPSAKGAIFYPLFNRFSGTMGKLETGSARLVSRRALNRVHSMSAFMPYRKAAYAASGLRATSLPLGSVDGASRHSNLGLAIDSLALYTNFFYKASAVISVAMVCISLLEMVYVLVVLAQGRAIEGWVTSMFVMTLGFLGLFIIMTFLMKYVALLVDAQFNDKNYLVESVQKIEGCR